MHGPTDLAAISILERKNIKYQLSQVLVGGDLNAFVIVLFPSPQ